MPLLYNNHFTNIKMGIWHITEPLAFFDERNFVKPMGKSMAKYTQHVAGWHTVQWLTAQQVAPAYHNEIGYPYDAFGEYVISISHSKKYAAALVANFMHHKQIGIDIEMFGEKAYALRQKFATMAEWALVNSLFTNSFTAACIIWSIKEAIYKQKQERGVRFKEDIQLWQLTQHDDKYVFNYRYKQQEFTGFMWVFEDFCCCVCF